MASPCLHFLAGAVRTDNRRIEELQRRIRQLERRQADIQSMLITAVREVAKDLVKTKDLDIMWKKVRKEDFDFIHNRIGKLATCMATLIEQVQGAATASPCRPPLAQRGGPLGSTAGSGRGSGGSGGSSPRRASLSMPSAKCTTPSAPSRSSSPSRTTQTFAPPGGLFGQCAAGAALGQGTGSIFGQSLGGGLFGNPDSGTQASGTSVPGPRSGGRFGSGLGNGIFFFGQASSAGTAAVQPQPPRRDQISGGSCG